MAASSTAPLSARGVQGESKLNSLRNTINTHGGDVPYYDIYGQQHYRLPHKDKSTFARVEQRPEWTHEPKHKTRSQLLAARKEAKIPHISYDVDGDGVVGPADYFIGKTFGREKDHRLNTGERADVVRALESGWMNNYQFGHDQAGAKRPFPVRQMRGKIIHADNIGEIADAYPPHWNAHHEPRHPGRAEMELKRKSEMRNAANSLKREYDAKFPNMVPEPPVTQEFMVEKPATTHITERRERFRQEAREAGGLERVGDAVNPIREEMEVGLTYNHVPQFATRTAMNEDRRTKKRLELEETRAKAEHDYVPIIARHSMADAGDFDFRRGFDPETCTKLKDRRRKDFVEYNMANFGLQQKEELPRYSDQHEPWWTLQEGFVKEPETRCLLHDVHDPPKPLPLNITEVKFKPRAKQATPSTASEVPPPPLLYNDLGRRTVQRWTTEFVPAGLRDNAPRLFDGVKHAPTYTVDQAPLHTFSSFEPIVREGQRADLARQQRAAAEDEERARHWRQQRFGAAAARAVPPSDTDPEKHDATNPKISVLPPGEKAPSVPREGGLARGVSESKAESLLTARVAAPPVRKVSVATLAVEAPGGDEVSMTERLHRMGKPPPGGKGHEGQQSAGVTPRAGGITPRSLPGVGQQQQQLQASEDASSLSPQSHRAAGTNQMTVRTGIPARHVPGFLVTTGCGGGFQWLDRNATRRPGPGNLTVPAQSSVAPPPPPPPPGGAKPAVGRASRSNSLKPAAASGPTPSTSLRNLHKEVESTPRGGSLAPR